MGISRRAFLRGLGTSVALAAVGCGGPLGYRAANTSAPPPAPAAKVQLTGLVVRPGGGIGLSGRKYGLTCDAVTAVDLVTVDGTPVHASADENPDVRAWCSGPARTRRRRAAPGCVAAIHQSMQRAHSMQLDQLHIRHLLRVDLSEAWAGFR